MNFDPRKRFSDRVENYVKYRPHYPEELLDFMKAECGLDQSSVIADIGSGTGISSELFLKNG
ncbi:MAG TPA: SAM-dependent methyltransferase, partial [Ignavibacteria bacterium]|nr:SAM-dependent methyltransferase [Bacteroidota bacterium]HRI84252.1 SAM-dependent methyltransferase [Ignavibacteria bacterium]